MSADEYTPTDEQMQADWHAYITTPDEENYYYDALSSEEADARWSRWLAAHDARVRRDAARAERERVGRLENRAASETARANTWRDKHRVMAGKRDAAHRAYQAEREARREAEARIKAVQDVLDNIDTSNDPALHDGFADMLRALDG